MRLLKKRPNLSTPQARELRECWLFTAGSAPGVIEHSLTRAWSILAGEEVSQTEYENLTMEIHLHYRNAKGLNTVKWARLEWNGFDPLPYRSVFGYNNQNQERVG